MVRRSFVGFLVAVGMIVPIGTGTALADRDTDFATALHGFGIYGQRDYNAWLAKITCKRLDTGVDGAATDSAQFLKLNLARSSSTEQVWQFLGTALRMYCPGHLDKITADQGRP